MAQKKRKSPGGRGGLSGNSVVTANFDISRDNPPAQKKQVKCTSSGLRPFGKIADLIGYMNPLIKNRYTAHDGQEREGWSLNVESVVSARTVRPSGGRKRAETARAAPAGASAGNGAPFDDPIPQGAP